MSCAHCGCALVQPRTGRRRKHCSPACRTAAWRDRRRLALFIAAGVVHVNGRGPEIADPSVSLAFGDEAARTFQVSGRLVGVPWFEIWLAQLGYDLRGGSPLEGAPLRLPRGEKKAAA